jgi:hypothetical protein
MKSTSCEGFKVASLTRSSAAGSALRKLPRKEPTVRRRYSLGLVSGVKGPACLDGIDFKNGL